MDQKGALWAPTQKKRGPPTDRRAFLLIKSEILLNALGSELSVITDGDGELDLMRLRELIQPIQEVLGLAVAFDLDDLGQAVDKDMGNIIIAGVQTADKALQSGVAGDIILAGLDQSNLIMDVKGQFIAFFDANYISVLGLNGVVDHINDLLGLTRALLSHNNTNHVNHSLDKSIGGVPFLVVILPYSAGLFN